MAEAMARATAKEQIMLAAMAGRSSVQDAAAARVGEAIEQRARAGRRPGTHRADTGPHEGLPRQDQGGARGLTAAAGPTAPGADAPSLAACAAPSLRVGSGVVSCPGGVGHDGAMTEARAGMLLVATPALLDPNFADTVVLLLDVDDNGALGVVLNRPSGVPVGDVLSDWGEVVAEPGVLFHGGPVSTEGALAVGLLRDSDDAPVGFREVFGQLGIVDLDTPVELVDGSLDGMRIFAGYAGWGAEQLVGEIEEGSWYVVPAQPRDVFRGDPDELWRDVLRRQPGELAWHSTRPVDPDLN